MILMHFRVCPTCDSQDALNYYLTRGWTYIIRTCHHCGAETAHLMVCPYEEGKDYAHA